MNKKPLSKEVRSVKHVSTLNTKSINKAVEKASKDRDFIFEYVLLINNSFAFRDK